MYNQSLIEQAVVHRFQEIKKPIPFIFELQFIILNSVAVVFQQHLSKLPEEIQLGKNKQVDYSIPLYHEEIPIKVNTSLVLTIQISKS